VMIPGSWRPGATLDETLTPDGVKAV